MNTNNTYLLWFNRLIKLWGYCALIVGSIMSFSSAYSVYIEGNPVLVNGVESTDNVNKAILVFVPLVFAILGWFVIRAKPISKKNNPSVYSSFEIPEKPKQPWEK